MAVVSDGAGSAARSEVGSAVACDSFQDELAKLLEGGGTLDDLDRAFFLRWLIRFNAEIQARADAEGLSTRDFACTLLGAIVAPDAAAFCQIGDGAIVVATDEGYEWVFWPQEGEYANQTHFTTDADVADYLEFCLVWRPVVEVALFSDGLQRLALQFASRTAHQRFFRPLLAEVRQAPAGHAEALSEQLAVFLSSERMATHTDDDLTLILASRCDATAGHVPSSRTEADTAAEGAEGADGRL